MSFFPLVRLWLWISVLASVAGWSLSALGQLNRPGYAVFFAAFAVLILICRKKLGLVSSKTNSRGKKFLRRFRQPLPLSFAVLAFLVFLGGVLYPPGNYTGLNYRVARVLQWLAHGQWCWIHTPNFRMNDRACGIEWLTAPLLLFTKSDRALFLINFIPFLLLPGLVFSLFRRLGVRARVAWHWMWLLPTGYNFLVQAAGVANDTFPAVYVLAALDFGCRAWVSRRPADLWHSILAAALLTGAKASNLPLLLPWAVLIFALLPVLRRQTAMTLLVIFLAALVSFLPTAILNVHYLGDWSGLSIERAGMNMKNPVVGVWGNTLLLLLNNFVPPLFPLAGWWNQHALNILPQFLIAPMTANFEQGFQMLPELPTEDWAGIGFGLSLLLLVSVSASFLMGRSAKRNPEPSPLVPAKLCRWVLIAPWFALMAFGMKSGMVTPQRLIAPYYPLLLPLFLVGAGQSQIIRRCWWRVMVGVVLLLALVVLVLSPDRPLWPAKTILSGAQARHPGQHLTARALKVYTIYSGRSDPLAGVRALLPPDIKVVGFIGTEDDTDISLWRPFGERRVEHFFLTDPPEQIRQHVQCVVLGGFNLKEHNTTLDAWLQSSGAELVATTNATLKVAEGLQPWYVVRFKQ
ncbi:MAG: hypothetical protein ABSF10_06360 [Verrucomicrobiota bacterium]|jgi:hypothetical protein